MDELKPLILLSSGLILNLLTYVGQAWAKSHSQTFLYDLPVITCNHKTIS